MTFLLRYGAYYYESMVNLKENYPGAEDDMKENGLSVLAQSFYPVMTAADQRGEQTINRDAKTTGNYSYGAQISNQNIDNPFNIL